MKKKVIISACLLGEYCRYDGKTKIADDLIQKYKNYEIVPFCPEAPIFGTPREKINILKINGKNRVFTEKTKKDVTEVLKKEINSFIKANPNIDEIVLKSKSPSCGIATAPIHNLQGKKLCNGDGIATEIFKNTYIGIILKESEMS